LSSAPLDPRQALAAARRALAATPTQLASGVARVVRDSPDEWLGQMMQTPARRVVLEVLFWQLAQRVDAAGGVKTAALVRWRILGSEEVLDVYEIELAGGRSQIVRRLTERQPRLTISIDAVELLRIASGESDPARTYLRGGLAVSGDLVLAARLAWLLRARSAGVAPPQTRRAPGSDGGSPQRP